MTYLTAPTSSTLTTQTLIKTTAIITLMLLSGQSIAQAAVSAPATASTTPQKTSNNLSVGVNVMYTDNAYDVDENKVRVLPSIFYDNGKVYARGVQLGGYLLQDETNQVTAFIQPSGAEFDPDDANGALKGLDKRKVSGMVGLGYQRRISYAVARAQVATDVLGHSKGTVARLSLGTRYPLGEVMLMPSVGVQWSNDDYNDYYFGVSDKESAQTGVAAYDADSSINPFINVNANYALNEDWSLFLGQSIYFLSDEQQDSPMVDDKVTYRTTLGVNYSF